MIYLDSAASTPNLKEVIKEMKPFIEGHFSNGESRIDFIDAFLKRIRFFEEVFKIEWEVCEYIGDDGFDWA